MGIINAYQKLNNTAPTGEIEHDLSVVDTQDNMNTSTLVPSNLTSFRDARELGLQLFNQSPNLRKMDALANLKGFLAKVKRWFTEPHLPRAGLPEKLELSLPGKASKVPVKGECFAAMIKTLPRMDRQSGREGLVATLNKRLEHGAELLKSLQLEPAKEACTEADAADLMFYIQIAEEAAGNGFTRGSYSIEDPNGHLAAFLNTCPTRYQRSSTHVQDLQTSSVFYGKESCRNTPRGIDFPCNSGGLLHGHATILFGIIPENGGKAQRLFLKAETYGCRISSMMNSERKRGIAEGDRPDRPCHFSDAGTGLCHLGQLIKSFFKGSDGGRRESFSDLKDAYKALQASYEKTSYIHQILDDKLETKSSKGVYKILQNLHEIMDTFPDIDDDDKIAFLKHSRPLRLAMCAYLTETDHLDTRIGNEVQRSLGDLLNTNRSAVAPSPDQKLWDIGEAMGMVSPEIKNDIKAWNRVHPSIVNA